MMSLKQTPLYQIHKEQGGRMVPFAGWEMPVQYSSILEEHRYVRNKCGLFDVSHMGEITITGPKARPWLDALTCNQLDQLEEGRVQYNAVPNEGGGLIDDITVYCLTSDQFFLVVNASNYDAVLAHLKERQESGVEVKGETEDWHQLALQGPQAEALFVQALGLEVSNIKYYHFRDLEYKGRSLRISRTGYTGEDGFEIYSDNEIGPELWNTLLAQGKDAISPAGLGARDILRLEAGYPLYGHELNERWTPVESGIGWIAKQKQTPYPGYDQIIDHKQNGAPGRVTGFIQDPGGIPREGYAISDSEHDSLATVLSGAHSPSLKAGIGTAYLPMDRARADHELFVHIRDRKIPAKTIKGAFVKGSAGKV